MAIVVHWLLLIIVIVGVAVAVGVLVVIAEKKVSKVYRENCWDVISVGVAVTSVALVVYFGDWIKFFVKLNLVVLLLLVQAGADQFVRFHGTKNITGNQKTQEEIEKR